MTADPEHWRDVLTNFETFLEHAPWSQKMLWAQSSEQRNMSEKVSLAYSWKEDALREFERVTRG